MYGKYTTSITNVTAEAFQASFQHYPPSPYQYITPTPVHTQPQYPQPPTPGGGYVLFLVHIKCRGLKHPKTPPLLTQALLYSSTI